MRDWEVNINFAGYIGADETYFVEGEDADDAVSNAIEEAKEDLVAEDIVQIDEDQWEVTISFHGFIGTEEIYIVAGDNESEAEDAALEEASWDLSGEVVSEDRDLEDFDDELEEDEFDEDEI